MRILHVNKHYPPHVGGIETVAQQLADILGGEVLCCQERGARSTERVRGVAVTRAASFGRLFSVPLSLDFFVLFRQMVRQADMVVYHHPFPLVTLAHLLFARQKKVVIWYHSDIVRQRLLGGLFAPLLRWSLARAHTVIAASAGLCRYSVFLASMQDKVAIIPFAAAPQAPGENQTRVEYEAARIRAHYGHRPIMLAVGRLVYYKGFQILPEVLRNIPEAVCLVIGAGPLQHMLVQEAKRVGVEDRFYVMPPVADLRPYFAAGTVFAFPSNAPSEAFGIVQVEALAAGLPVVNMNVPSGVPEVGVDGVTGYTVPLNDVSAFAVALTRIIRDPELRAELSAGARKRAGAEFGYTTFTERVRKLFATIQL